MPSKHPAMTFDPKDKTHKSHLYTALVAAAELEGAYFDDFLQRPFETPWNLATGYRRNLQRGDYSAIRAQVLYDWLMNRHFATAHVFAPDIFPFTPEMRLQQIVDDHAITRKLRLVLSKSEFGIVQHRRATDNADETIKLGQDFYLELDADDDGYAVAFQVVRNQWHPVPLVDAKHYEVEIRTGVNVLPQTSSEQPDPIHESHDLGLHQFVVVASGQPNVPSTLNGLLQAWVNGQMIFHILAINIVE